MFTFDCSQFRTVAGSYRLRIQLRLVQTIFHHAQETDP
jgi:hypothetical protein